VVVNVRLLVVLLLFLPLVVVVAVRQRVVVVFVAMPRTAMFPRVERVTRMVMCNVVVIVCVNLRRVCMCWLVSLALSPLLRPWG
jgi:hypothetical protein